MSKSAALHRFAWAILIALLLGLRALGAAGYMPEVDHGRLTIMLCPDGEWASSAAPMPGMEHHQSPAHQQHRQCPYAAAAAIPFAAGSAPILAVPLLAFALLGIAFLPSLVVRSRAERPKQTGPPIPA